MKNHIAYAVLLATAAFAIAPAVTNPFMGFTADQLPVPQIDPPIQPAGYAFSIWGLIYSWLILSAVFGVWKRPQDEGWNNARAPLLVSAATFVSVGSTMAGYAIITDSQGWAYIGITLALIVALTVQWMRPSAPEYGLTVVWALIGIIVFNGTGNLPVTTLAAAGAIIVGGFALLRKDAFTFSDA